MEAAVSKSHTAPVVALVVKKSPHTVAVASTEEDRRNLTAEVTPLAAVGASKSMAVAATTREEWTCQVDLERGAVSTIKGTAADVATMTIAGTIVTET